MTTLHSYLASVSVVAVALAVTSAQAASDIYLKIQDIKGESYVKRQQDQIDVLSYSWGSSKSSSVRTGAIRARGEPVKGPGSLSVTMPAAVASAHLYQYCAKGKHIPIAILYMRKSPSQAGYTEYKMEDVRVSCIAVPMSDAPMPVEEITFNYQKIDW